MTVECEENLPEPRDSLRTELELGTVLLGREAVVDLYYRLAPALARHYGVTLCDEPEAQLIGATVWSDIFFNRGTEISELSAQDHLHFLRNYLNLHGLDASFVTDAQVRKVLTWSSRGTFGDAYDYFTGEYEAEASAVLATIRSLTGRYSIPTPRQRDAEQAELGGTIIPGSKFDFPACNRGEARAFRAKATRRVAGHYSRAVSASGAVPGSVHMRYQVNKCGNREYSLRTDATPQSYKPLADGLAPEPPPRAKAGFAFGCCILEAKYAYGPITTYQKRRDFLRATKTYADRLPRRLRGLGRPALIAYWTAIWADQAAQFGLYMGAIADPDIPYWKVVYICSQEKAREYFQSIISTAKVPRAIAVACVSDARRTTENWIV